MAQLDKYAADLWVLSPPCQPFTRQGLKKDVQDFRAAPFQALLGRLPLMKRPPRCRREQWERVARPGRVQA